MEKNYLIRFPIHHLVKAKTVMFFQSALVWQLIFQSKSTCKIRLSNKIVSCDGPNKNMIIMNYIHVIKLQQLKL